MISVSNYILKMYFKSGRWWLDLVLFLCFFLVILDEPAGADFSTSSFALTVFLCVFSVFIIIRQFRRSVHEEYIPLVVRKVGRVGVVSGMVFSQGCLLAAYTILGFGFLCFDSVFRSQISMIAFSYTLIGSWIAALTAGIWVFHFLDFFRPYSRNLTPLGLCLLLLGFSMISSVFSNYLSPFATVIVQHVLPPLNPLIHWVGVRQLSFMAWGELTYAVIYIGGLIFWAIYRWKRIDLFIRVPRY